MSSNKRCYYRNYTCIYWCWSSWCIEHVVRVRFRCADDTNLFRPIPTGKVNKNQALVFGIALSIFSVIALDFFANRISASLLLFTILFYVLIYTVWLKRKTPQNIVIGGAAGALPPVIGWAIATNSLIIRTYYILFNNFLLDPISFLGTKSL